ncbi:uncharacterized protein LOC129228358 [Uloborus diversus]|uniref:uncharacterized protein LOC129228358 n=1 Tax=Uloborus diversus TaxID=327109 RepID=UPI0024093CBF|nr:uncharacterized protein LOC129228358 [Uloborus diversus]
METADVMIKSVLKKSDAVVKKGKKVSFCNTVKLFIEDEDSKINENEEKLKCVEISIVDSKKENLAIISDSLCHDDCSITDFLVHKVVYENGVTSDDDVEAPNDETEENILYSEPSEEEEDLEFVVHKVTEHEDDLIQQELEFEASNLENENESKTNLNCNELVISKFSKLSVENILVHDKIIAFIDQKKLSLPSSDHILSSKLDIMPDFSISKDFSGSSFDDFSSIKNTELILSPPLQELSLKKIVEAQSDNTLCELDISPLNSIQETDSESDISSEGTMIMMTSEECEKNEQHIRESLLQYESLKEKLSKSEDDEPSDNPNDSLIINAQAPDDSTKMPEDVQCETVPSLEDINTESSIQKTFEESEEISIKKSFVEDNEKPSIQTELYEPSSNKLVKFESSLRKPKPFFQEPVVNLEEENNLDLSYVHAIRKASLKTPNNVSYWEKSLSSVEIPKDVREWKILLSRLNKNADGMEPSHQQNMQSYETDTDSESSFCSRGESDSSKFALSVEESPSSTKSDELESFVHQSTERVERIRNRYLVKNKPRVDLGFVRNSSVRGIRPRFGSTAEILQRMQERNLPHFSASSKTHLSWPCHETHNPEFDCSRTRQPSHYYFSQNISGEYSSQTSFTTHRRKQFAYCDHNSMSSCPSIFLHERGAPEGASPPRSLSEDSIDQSFDEDNPNSVVYYSMKV